MIPHANYQIACVVAHFGGAPAHIGKPVLLDTVRPKRLSLLFYCILREACLLHRQNTSTMRLASLTKSCIHATQHSISMKHDIQATSKRNQQCSIVLGGPQYTFVLVYRSEYKILSSADIFFGFRT